MSSGASTRRHAIVELAHASGLASVEELSTRFDVTASTIRRDLAILTADGKIARTFGGAMAVGVNGGETTFLQRNQEQAAAKRAMARYARTLVRDGETILLDAGSSVAALAHEIRTGISLTVATTSIAVVQELADSDQHHVECLGGTFRQASSGFVGPLTEGALERMTFDTVFLGADGVTTVGGGEICEADLQQTRLKELICQRADTVYVLADSTKLGREQFHARARLPSDWVLVTDAGATVSARAEFAAAGIDVRVIGPDGNLIAR